MRSVRSALADVLEPTQEIVESIVWCTVSTVDPSGSPRSRLMHPVWAWDGEVPVGLVTARTTALKVRHLAAHPHVSCFYWDPSHHTVAIDAVARWLPRDERIGAWRTIEATAPPVGFDPAMIWPDGPDSVDCGILELRATRIVTSPVGRQPLLWTAG